MSGNDLVPSNSAVEIKTKEMRKAEYFKLNEEEQKKLLSSKNYHSPDGDEIVSHFLPNCRVVSFIALSDKTLNFFIDLAIKRISHSISLPGFRKGKAPKDWVLKNYKEEIQRTAFQQFLESKLVDLIQLQQIPMLQSNPEVRMYPGNEQGYFDLLSVKWERFPELPEVELADCKINIPDIPEITNEERESAWLRLKSHSAEKKAADRPIQMNDDVKVTFIGFDELNEKILDDTRNIIVGEPIIPNEVHQKLIGSSKGDSFDLDEEIASKIYYRTPILKLVENRPIVRLQCTIDEVLEMNIPSDEEISKKFEEEGKSIESYKKTIEARLDSDINFTYLQVLDKLLEKYLIDHYSFELPQAVLNNIENTLLKVKKSGRISAENWADFEQKERKRIIEGTRALYLKDKLLKSISVQMTQADLDEEIKLEFGRIIKGQSKLSIQDFFQKSEKLDEVIMESCKERLKLENLLKQLIQLHAQNAEKIIEKLSQGDAEETQFFPERI